MPIRTAHAYGLRAAAATLLCALAAGVHAAPIVLNGATQVTTIDRLAVFSSLTSSVDLGSYTEDSLKVQTPASHVSFLLGGCSVCWYPNGGFDDFATQSANLARVAGTDGARMSALEFNLYSGFSIGSNTLVWEAYRDGGLTGGGSFSWLGAGSVVSWSDVAGIDELRVGLFDISGTLASNTNNHIGIDNLKVELAAAVPEPAVVALLGLGLAGLGLRRRRR